MTQDKGNNGKTRAQCASVLCDLPSGSAVYVHISSGGMTGDHSIPRGSSKTTQHSHAERRAWTERNRGEARVGRPSIQSIAETANLWRDWWRRASIKAVDGDERESQREGGGEGAVPWVLAQTRNPAASPISRKPSAVKVRKRYIHTLLF